MSTRKNQIKTNEEKIVKLHDERRSIFAGLTKTKDEEEFHSENRKCIELLGKINVLEKKNEFMKQNLPPNGVADIGSEVRIME